jgi:hypothetical protein
MDITYDIFERLADAGPPRWIETVHGLEQARRRLSSLSAKGSGTYVVYDLRLGMFIEVLNSRSSGLLAKPGRFPVAHN